MTMTPHPRRSRALAGALLLLAGAVAGGLSPAMAQSSRGGAEVLVSRPVDAGHLLALLRRLNTIGSVLYIAAHPDDENTALLASLANGRGVETTYLSMTRGDGGQNLIGSEQGDLLGVIRTEELLAARRIDGASQLFARAIDFGYSKSADETLAVWGRDEALADVVRAIRRTRPDVIVARFPTTGEGGHGHHTASAMLAEEAFAAAGDPARFPEQLAELDPWRPRRLYWNRFAFGGVAVAPPDADRLLRVELGAYDPALGRSYTEIAGESRSQHKSQGFGAAERRGSFPNWFDLCAGEGAGGGGGDLLDGIDLSWSRVPGSEAVAAPLRRALAELDAREPAAVLPLLVTAHRELAKLPRDFWTAVKAAELDEAIRAAAGLWIEAMAAEPTAVPGSPVKVTVTAVNRSGFPIALAGVDLPYGGASPLPAPRPLGENQAVAIEGAFDVPRGLPPTEPYWLADPAEPGRHRVPDPALIGLPEAPPSARVRVALLVGPAPAERVEFEIPVENRRVDPVLGEIRRPLEIVPRATLELDRRVYVFTQPEARSVAVRVRSGDAAVSGTVKLRLPQGFRAEPAEHAVSLEKPGDEALVRFLVTPPRGATTGRVAASLETEGGRLDRALVRVSYPHIPEQTLFPPAAARVIRLDLGRGGRRIGYVTGAGDAVPEALEEAGYEVTRLTDADLETRDLTAFDAIAMGVRAYNTRPRLRNLQGRLHEYVRGGGTLLVQYNVDRGLVVDPVGPAPMKLARGRVTVEDAKVTLVEPRHPVLDRPNPIQPSDFEGWVQERGLYFASEWDGRYETPIETGDPGEKPLRGGLLVLSEGKGAFVYTGLAFFRQLPAGVPGAYRLFANLLAAGALDSVPSGSKPRGASRTRVGGK